MSWLNFSVIFLSWIYSVKSGTEHPKTIEIPVFNINFYLMGQEEVDESITVRIGDNIDYLNKEFKGKIKFRLNYLFMDAGHAFIPDLHYDYSTGSRLPIEDLLESSEKQGGINVFLFRTYAEEKGSAAMLGFTPILSRHQSIYALRSPKFDRMFIAYSGLLNKSTLVHEMGHFLGLKHPWEMSEIDRELMGLCQCHLSESNHMTYNEKVDNFTNEQLERMHHFALSFRQYLLSHIEIVRSG